MKLTILKNSMRKLLVIGTLLLSISFACAEGTKSEDTSSQEKNLQESNSEDVSLNESKSKDVNHPQEKFWQSLKKHCGKSYAGTFDAENIPEDFKGKELVMYVMECEENVIKVPFHVGDDLSRTWVFTRTADGIELKHDHRLEDGSHDEVTMYGGTTSNTGLDHVQFFPADQETSILIPDASGNMWWVTIDDKEYTYNLKRVNTPNHFRVAFDLTKEIPTPERPWGH